MSLFADLSWRGLVHQATDPGLDAWLESGSRTLYCGFDPSANSLHVGNLVPVMILRRFQKAGHRPIVVVGGATGMIGDPSGKSEERNLLSREALAANIDAQKRQLTSFLDFDGPQAARLVNNFDWIGKFSFLEFLRDVGKNFPVNVMLGKDSVKSRLERDRRRAELHRIQLHAAAGLRFCASQRASRLPIADRRQRSMGKHHGRHRPGPADALRAAVWPDLPAADQERRHEDGQDRVGRRVAVGRPHQPLPVLSILDQRRRRRCRQMPADVDRSAAGRNRAVGRRPVGHAGKA